MTRVLVVDDNKDILQVVQIVLEIRGYEVKAIWNGEEVQQSIIEFSPNVILLDVMLGNTSGIIICNDIKSNPNTKDVCVIMFSAHGKKEDILKLCPANNFISKPFEIDTLTETIENEIAKCN